MHRVIYDAFRSKIMFIVVVIFNEKVCLSVTFFVQFYIYYAEKNNDNRARSSLLIDYSGLYTLKLIIYNNVFLKKISFPMKGFYISINCSF